MAPWSLKLGSMWQDHWQPEELARQGALVIKIEQAKGDPSRYYLSKANFTSLNAAKMSLVLIKNNPELYQAILTLADDIIDNRAPQAKEEDKLLQNFLKAPGKTHPVIFCSIVGYDSQENKHRRALDVSVQAETGMAMVRPGHIGNESDRTHR
jgi:crotonobetainyl-CoA:carnitine CoA-transferase CaiB-like acyl-CoA transferase